MLLSIHIALFSGHLIAQTNLENEKVNVYKKFLNGTFDTQSGCSNLNASKSTITYFPLKDNSIGGEVKILKDGISKIIHTFTIENIELVDANSGLYKIEIVGKNESAGTEYESVRIMQFDGLSTRTMERNDDGEKIISNGIIIRSGLESKPYFNCASMPKPVQDKDSYLNQIDSKSDLRLTNYIQLSKEARSWIFLIGMASAWILPLFFFFKFSQSAGKLRLNQISTDLGGGSFSTLIVASCKMFFYAALLAAAFMFAISAPAILNEII